MEKSYRLRDISEMVRTEFEKRAVQDYTPFSTGFELLDVELGGGFGIAQVHFIAAQPGAGKTTFLVNVAQHNCINDRPVLFISAELPTIDLLSRFITVWSNSPEVDWKSVRIGMNESSISNWIESAKTWPLYIVGSEELGDPDFIKSGIPLIINKIFSETGKIPLICLDYLQLFALKVFKDYKGKDYRQKIDAVSSSLINLVAKTNCSVLCLSSTARQNYSRGGDDSHKNINVLSMGKESGQIEFDAGTVCGMFEGRKFEEDGIYKKIVEFRVGKNRFYKSGVAVEFCMDGASGKFTELCVRDYKQKEDEFCEIMDLNGFKKQKEIVDATNVSKSQVSRLLQKYGYKKNSDGVYKRNVED